MQLDLWLAFVAASAILLLIPGPTVLLVISYALGEGRRSALSTVAGVTLGDLTSVTLAMAGLGALLATSTELFTALRWIGAAYLVVICLLPEVLISQYGVPFYFGGTSILIVVSVTMDTVTQVQSHLLAHQYEGLIRKARVKGRR